MEKNLMELIDELASELVERRYKENTYYINFNGDIHLSEEAQDDYNNISEKIEELCKNF